MTPEPAPTTAARRRWLAAACAAAALLAAGCRQDMHDAPRIDPLEPSAFFENGAGARPIPEGTVARGQLREDTHLYTGKDASGELVASFPMPITREVLEHGRERYEIFCSPCHDSLGTGRGMIVRRGFKQPSSYHEQRLREMPVGYFYDVITQGFGTMSSYASRVPVEDRWAIVAYVRVLQASRNQPLAELPAEVRQAFEASLASDEHAPEGAEH